MGGTVISQNRSSRYIEGRFQRQDFGGVESIRSALVKPMGMRNGWQAVTNASGKCLDHGHMGYRSSGLPPMQGLIISGNLVISKQENVAT